MRSRSYYAIAGSSFLLLSISCMTQSKKPEDRPDRMVEGIADAVDAKADDKKADDKKAEDPGDDGGWEPHGHPEALDSGEAASSDEGGAAPPDATGGLEPQIDGCALEAMQFEGKCTPKDKVEKILDRRERIALDKYQKAKKPQQAAEAAHDLLEQQVAQSGKMEDDLDEILEVLRKEKRQKGGSKKGDF